MKQGDSEEQLREALLELDVLRQRESDALRQSNALLEGLAAVSQGSSPGEGVASFLQTVGRNLKARLTLLVAPNGSDGQILYADQTGLIGASLPLAAVEKPRVRRISDLERVSWWDGLTAPFSEMHSFLGAPITLSEGKAGALICLGEERDQFSSADQSLIARLATLASQALATLALSKRNALLAGVIEGASASVAIADATDPAMPLVYVNQAFLDLSGYDREEVLGANCRFLSVEPPDSVERVRLRETVADRSFGTFNLRNRRKDGSEFWNRLTLYPIAGEDGDVRMMVATQVDITAERAAEEERDAARNRLVGALSSTSEGFLLLNAHGRIVFVNPRFREFFESEQVVWQEGEIFVDVWRRRLIDLGTAPGAATRIARARRDALFSGSRDREEQLPDGRVLLINDHPTRDGGAVSIATNITSIKATETILKQRAVAIDSAQDGIAITDTDGRFVYMNPSHLNMFGYSNEVEVLGRHWSTLYRADQAEHITRVGIPEVERTGTWRAILSGVSKTGDLVAQEISLTLIKDVGLVCVARDTSERDRDQQERNRLLEQLQQAQRQEAIGQLAAGVAHDFNNVLSAIDGSAALLGLDLAEDHPGKTHLERISSAADRAANLVDRLLDLGARKRTHGRIDLRQSTEEAADLLRAGLTSLIKLKVSVPEEPVIAEADPTDVLQVLLNLGINARDACPDEGGEVGISLDEGVGDDALTLSIGELDPASRYARFRVSDTGAGISAENIAKIFSPYFSTKGADGTGLGLAVMTSIIKQAGGAARVDSALDVGTTFEVFWPLRPSEDQVRQDPPTLPQLASKNALAGRMVLVCDDAELVAQVIAGTLEQAGAETAICTDPLDALDAIQEDPEAWDLLVTDFDMPSMSGAELSAAIRKARSAIPIILVSALDQPASTRATFAAVLEKPVEAEELIATAHAAIMAGKEQGRPDE
ncbi:MAG: PAS domain-containing protein [Pseudomonadota bacterium]